MPAILAWSLFGALRRRKQESESTAAADMAGAAHKTPSPVPLRFSPLKVVMPSAGGRTFSGNGAADMAGAAHKTPSPGMFISNTDHKHGQPSARVGADKTHAPQAR
jgi:hypothetical protein